VNWFSSAPANLMLLGEHSVVYGQPALACAVDQKIEIHWSKTDDQTLCIESALANFQFTLSELKQFDQHPQLDHPQLRFVMHALKTFAPFLEHGLHLKIVSEFSSTIGLGSSAAVLAATLHGLNRITQQKLDTLALFNRGHEIIQTIQGRGSGTDLAASLTGGVVLFKPKTQHQAADIQKLPDTLSKNLALTLIYCGYKTPTAEVLQLVSDNWKNKPQALDALYKAMGNTTQQACVALEQAQYDKFYAFSNQYQDYMNTLGVSDSTLDQIIHALTQCPSIFASKISGSGLGDCVLGFGTLTNCPAESHHTLQTFTQIDVDISSTGATTEQLN